MRQIFLKKLITNPQVRTPVQCIILDGYPLPESIDDGHGQLAIEIIFLLWAKVQLSNPPRLRDSDAALNQPTQPGTSKSFSSRILHL